MRHKDGHWIWTEARGKVVERTDDNRPKRMIGTLADITARRRREELLTIDRDRIALAERAAGAGAWDWNMTTQQLYWTEAMFRLLGLDPANAEASFDIWRSVVHPDDVGSAERHMIRAVADRKPLFSRYRIIRADGEERWIDVHGDTEYDEAGKPRRMSGICFDVTEEQKLTDEPG
jgi:PAS domain S-box-containing protein